MGHPATSRRRLPPGPASEASWSGGLPLLVERQDLQLGRLESTRRTVTPSGTPSTHGAKLRHTGHPCRDQTVTQTSWPARRGNGYTPIWTSWPLTTPSEVVHVLDDLPGDGLTDHVRVGVQQRAATVNPREAKPP